MTQDDSSGPAVELIGGPGGGQLAPGGQQGGHRPGELLGVEPPERPALGRLEVLEPAVDG